MPRVGSKTRDDAHGDIEVHLVLACATASEDEVAVFLVATGCRREVHSVSSFAVHAAQCPAHRVPQQALRPRAEDSGPGGCMAFGFFFPEKSCH